MKVIMGFLLGSLGLFYPLLIASVAMFVYALMKRSWSGMSISAILLYPVAWLFSKYPPYPWAIFVPLIPIFFAVLFYVLKRGREKTQLINS